jgi:cell division septation protein DedD
MAAGAVVAGGLLVIAGAWWTFGGGTAAEVAATPGAIGAPVEDTAPVVSTNASFSVDVAATGVDEQARLAARRLEEAGWPAFTWRIDADRRHVLVGPYASLDEAENTQQALQRAGYPGARLHVDDRLRVTPAALSATRRPQSYPEITLVAAPGRLSFVFELNEEPRHVSGQRVGPTTFTVTAGPLRAPIEGQAWKAPGDVRLVKRVVLSKPARDPATMHGTVTLAENADASVRLQGRRVYVDVFRRTGDVPPVEETPAGIALGPAPISRPRPAVATPSVSTPTATSPPQPPPASQLPGGMEAYRTALQPLLARFEEVQPFLGATIATASPDILAALNGTCAQLEQAAAAITPPAEARGVHNLLTSAAHLARTATAPVFAGDRLAAVKEAGGQFAAAKIRLAELGR